MSVDVVQALTVVAGILAVVVLVWLSNYFERKNLDHKWGEE